MPFRHAHWAVLALFPIIVAAFWPGYFGDLRGAPFALHAHGIAATAWIALVAVQGWTVHHRRIAAHRVAGMAVFVVAPLFFGAGLLVIHREAARTMAQADPFHTAFGRPLSCDDMLSAAAFLALVCSAVAGRRRLGLHAGAMLATIWLVLPPILARLLPALPGFPGTGFAALVIAFRAAHVLTIGGALWLAWRNPASAAPFRFVAGVLAVEALIFELYQRHPGWPTPAVATLAIPAAPLAVTGILVAALALRLAWRRPRGLNSPAGSATAPA